MLPPRSLGSPVVCYDCPSNECIASISQWISPKLCRTAYLRGNHMLTCVLPTKMRSNVLQFILTSTRFPLLTCAKSNLHQLGFLPKRLQHRFWCSKPLSSSRRTLKPMWTESPVWPVPGTSDSIGLMCRTCQGLQPDCRYGPQRSDCRYSPQRSCPALLLLDYF